MLADAGPLGFILQPPPLNTGLSWSVRGIWLRHFLVYRRSIFANATPPVLEPILFFTAMAVGLAGYLSRSGFEGMSYATYVASGLVVTSAMFSGAFETTFSTFVRMRWQKTYDAMLSTHLRPAEIFTGELLFCGSIGALYSSIVTLVTLPLGARPTAWCLLVPLIGFATAYLFGSIGLIVTSFVKVMQNFNFFISGVISPMFFFAGTFFPVRGHNAVVDVIWFVLPLSHSVELSRALFRGQADSLTVWHVLTMLVYIVAAHTLAQRRMRGRVLG